MPKMMNTLTTLSLVLVAALARDARAHDGEDHGAPEAAPPATDAATGRRTASGQTGQFELLIKLAPRAGEPIVLSVFLADWATNAPVGDATIALEIQSSPPVTAAAEPAGRPGVYHAIARVPAGTYPVVATVTAGDRVDLVEIADVDFTPVAAIASPAAHDHAAVPWRAITIGAGVLVVLVVAGVTLARRRVARQVVPAAALLLAVSAPLVARGHEGEDHGAPAATESPAARSGGATYLAKESQFLLGILTRVVAERDVSARIATVGRVVPRVDGHAQIAAPQPGRVLAPPRRSLPFLGDRVRKGQVLLVLEQTPAAAESGDLRVRALEARTAIAQARARRDQARRDLERRRALAGVVAQKEIEDGELALSLAERDVELAEQQAGLFGGGALRRIPVTAPIDGVIAAAEVSLGEQVAADRKLYTVLEPSRLWVEADVFETDIARIEAAGTADVRLEGRPTAFAGRLFRLGQLVDPATRTVKAIFEVDNASGAFRPGMFAEVAIGAGAPRRSLVVPDAAVIEDGGRRFVFVHVTPEEFVRREVVLGERDGDDWAVRTGLRPGERVVVQGTYQLRTAR